MRNTPRFVRSVSNCHSVTSPSIAGTLTSGSPLGSTISKSYNATGWNQSNVGRCECTVPLSSESAALSAQSRNGAREAIYGAAAASTSSRSTSPVVSQSHFRRRLTGLAAAASAGTSCGSLIVSPSAAGQSAGTNTKPIVRACGFSPNRATRRPADHHSRLDCDWHRRQARLLRHGCPSCVCWQNVIV